MSAEHVLTMLNEHEVKFVDLRFTDTKGKEQHVTIPAHQVNAEFFEEGKMFDGSSIGGWKGINESDISKNNFLESSFPKKYGTSFKEIVLSPNSSMIKPDSSKRFLFSV